MEFSPERQRQFERPAAELAPLPIGDPEVQKRLILSAFPRADKPILPWLEEGADGHSLAERFRAYVESPEHAGETVDLTDGQRVDELLREVRRYTLH